MSDDRDDEATGPALRASVRNVDRVHSGFLKLDRATVSYSKFDGGTREFTFECLERGDAAAVLLLDPVAHKVWLVEQFRYATLAGIGGWIEELPAGVIRANEPPDESARREVSEETGFNVERLEHISTFYVSPGGTSERIHLYLALVKRGENDPEVAERTRDVEEDIRLIEVDVDDFLAEAKNGRVEDAKTLVAGLWLVAHWGRLKR